MKNDSDIKRKSSRLYYIVLAVVLLFITPALVFIYFTQDQTSDPASERIIRESAAARLGKNQNELSNEDFAKITENLWKISFFNPRTNC